MFETVQSRVGGRCKHILEPIIQLAVEIAREGREGRRIGTLFTVGDADVDVNHHRLRPSGDHPVAVGHPDGDHFVRHGDRARRVEGAGLRARERFDERREVGAGVGEQPVDAASRERGEVGLGDRGRGGGARLIHDGRRA